jgi:hypothetical protein
VTLRADCGGKEVRVEGHGDGFGCRKERRTRLEQESFQVGESKTKFIFVRQRGLGKNSH